MKSSITVDGKTTIIESGHKPDDYVFSVLASDVSIIPVPLMSCPTILVNEMATVRLSRCTAISLAKNILRMTGERE